LGKCCIEVKYSKIFLKEVHLLFDLSNFVLVFIKFNLVA